MASSSLSTTSTLSSSHVNPIDLPMTDALPYFDNELDTQPQLRAKVDREIQAELAKIKRDTTDPRLPPPSLDPFAQLPHLAQELDRIGAQGQKTTALDVARFQLLAPEAGLEASDEDWNKALDNAAAQLMYQEGRRTNVELLKRYGANHWRLHNYQQEQFARQYERATETLTAQTSTLNRRRRDAQTEAGKRLAALERKWTELISRGLQLEVANITAEHEIHALQLEEAELQKEVAQLEAQ